MNPPVRRLGEPDAEATQALRHEGFGNPRSQGHAELPTRRQSFGAFDPSGDLIGCLGVISDASYVGGVPVPSVGISGVTVAAEHRGRGALSPLFDAALRSAREDGAALATLFPTANGIYRRLGFEIVTELVWVTIPIASLASLASLPPPTEIELRRAEPADADAIRGLYSAWARQHNGPLARTGELFRRDDEEIVHGSSAVTLAERGGELLGSARWDRGPGYGSLAHVDVHELVSTGPEATLALLAMFATFGPVAGELRLLSSGLDELRTSLSSLEWTVTRRNPYMLRVLNPARAFTLRGWPPIRAEVALAVRDDRIVDNSGVWRLRLSDTGATCERESGADAIVPDKVATFSAAGLAMAYSGAWPCGSIRRAGHLVGSRENDLLLDAAFGGRQVHIRDYF